MDLSWAATIIIPLFLTPAILVLFTFRFFVPRSRSVPSNDLTYLFFFVTFVGIVNVTLLGYLAKELLAADPTANNKILLNLLFKNAQFNPWRPFSDFLSFFGAQIEPTNIVYFILDIHARPLLIFLLIAGLYKGAVLLERFFQLHAFWVESKCLLVQIFYWILYPVSLLLGFGDEGNVSFRRMKSPAPFKNWYSKLLSWMNYPIFHYWSIVTRVNPSIELLMIDVFADDENLYSGILTDWIPDQNEVLALSMHNTIRYYPEPKEQLDTKGKKDPTSNDLSKRKWKLVKNNGEMIFPFSRIKSLHLWQIRRGAKFQIWVSDKNTEEKLKWYLILMHNSPDIFKELRVDVFMSQEEYKKLGRRLRLWLGENGYTIPAHKINMNRYTTIGNKK